MIWTYIYLNGIQVIIFVFHGDFSVSHLPFLLFVEWSAQERKKAKDQEKYLRHQERIQRQEHSRMERELRAQQLLEVSARVLKSLYFCLRKPRLMTQWDGALP